MPHARLLLLLALAASGCTPRKPPELPDPREKGLYAEPRRLAFVCVTPGCQTTHTVKVSLVGDRRVAIKRIILSAEAGADFSFKPSQPTPFILGVKSDFLIEVTYTPQGSPSARSVDLVVTYTDASAVESPDRLEAGELKVPLVRRLVGEPVLTATPTVLSFGAVPVGTQKSLPVRLLNQGYGNVAVDIASVDAGHPDLRAELAAGTALVPDAGLELPITYFPTTPAYLRSTLLIQPGNPDVEPALVEVEGTSLRNARLALDPPEELDFGELPKGGTRTLVRHLVNQGGLELTLFNLTLSDASGNLQAGLADGGTSAVLPPLARVPLRVRLDGTTPAELSASLTIHSSDPSTPALEVPLYGTVTQPKLLLSPSSLSFGSVPVGWVITKPIELRNVGYGPLTLKNLSLVAGSSGLFTLRGLPPLPSVLDRDQRVAIEVEFRAETAAAFSGFVSVESDDPATPFAEVSLSSTAGTCAASCPITNGTANCALGRCEVGACNAGWFDTDGSAATGCECKEIGQDPGSFCSDGLNKGNLKDTASAQTSHTGVLPLKTDLDVIRFHAEDASNWTSDDFDVRIRLVSNDPTVRMCVYRHNTSSALTDCYWTNEDCPANREYRKDGSLGSSDDADFLIKIFRDVTAAPTCTPYTVYMSNG